jgi:hypothetical protein
MVAPEFGRLSFVAFLAGACQTTAPGNRQWMLGLCGTGLWVVFGLDHGGRALGLDFAESLDVGVEVVAGAGDGFALEAVDFFEEGVGGDANLIVRRIRHRLASE